MAISGHLNRVVVTGIGALTPLGLDMPATWDNLVAGRAGLDLLTLFQAPNMGGRIRGLTTLFEQAKVLVEKGPDRVSPFLAPMMIADIAAAQISIALGARGPNMCMTSACSSGSDAIAPASEYIKYGNAQVMIAGGSDAIINPLGIPEFSQLNA